MLNQFQRGEASALSQQWKVKSCVFTKSLESYVCKATASNLEGSDSEGAKKMGLIVSTVVSSCEAVGDAIDVSMRGHVREKVISNIDDITKTIVAAARPCPDNAGLTPEEKTSFFEKIEAAKLASTVLGDDGDTVRQDTEALALLFACLTSDVSASHRDSNTSIDQQLVIDFIKSCSRLADMDYTTAWAKLNSFTKSVADEDLSVLTSSAATMFTVKDKEFAALSLAIKENLDSVAIKEEEVKIHESIHAIEAFTIALASTSIKRGGVNHRIKRVC